MILSIHFVSYTVAHVRVTDETSKGIFLDLNLKPTAHQSLKTVNPITTVDPISSVSQLQKLPCNSVFSINSQKKKKNTPRFNSLSSSLAQPSSSLLKLKEKLLLPPHKIKVVITFLYYQWPLQPYFQSQIHNQPANRSRPRRQHHRHRHRRTSKSEPSSRASLATRATRSRTVGLGSSS